MGKASGVFVTLPPARQAIFDAGSEHTFAEPVPDFGHSKNLPLVCFVLSANGILTHIAKGQKGQRAGTQLRRLNMAEFVPVKENVSTHDLIEATQSRFQSKLQERIRDGGHLPEKTFQEVVSVLSRLAPSIASVLLQYSDSRLRRIAGLSDRAREALGEQKEAVATALSIAGIDRKKLLNWDFDKARPPVSFLEGLEQVRIREDPMIINDLHQLPGYAVVTSAQYGAVRFENADSRLTILLANRQPLEEQLGTDLIYFNETYSCFLMVQYKAMEREGNKDVFRFPNTQLDIEVARMVSVLEELRRCDANTVADGYRFSENPFFLKFCLRIVFNPDYTGLVQGMYLPLDYWLLLRDHPSMSGPHRGKQVSYRNARRYLDNTAFLTVASNAWVGTNIAQSAEIARYIESSLSTGRAVVFAVATDKQRRHHGNS